MKTPTLDKISRVREKSQAIGEFIDWLNASLGIILCKYYPIESQHYPVVGGEVSNISDLLAQYFEIDQTAAERERRKILGQLRRRAARKPAVSKRSR